MDTMIKCSACATEMKQDDVKCSKCNGGMTCDAMECGCACGNKVAMGEMKCKHCLGASCKGGSCSGSKM